LSDRRRARNWISIGALGVLIGGVVVVYPFALAAALPRLGVAGVAFALLALAALSIALQGWLGNPLPRGAAAPGLGVPVLLGLAAFSGDARYLQLVPSAVYLALAGGFYATLRSGDSIIERGVRALVPQAPDFIRPYCRKLTGLWAIFFAASAILAAVLALTGNRSAWELFTGRLVYALMIGATVVEFLVRKTWFRYYFHGGWFDRIWAKLFPAEATPEGRRSMQHISAYWSDRSDRSDRANRTDRTGSKNRKDG